MCGNNVHSNHYDLFTQAITSIAAQQKPKKNKRHDVPDDVKTPEVAAEPPSVVNGHKKAKEGSKTDNVTSPAPEKDRGEKKSKKRKRKEGDGDGSNAIEPTDTQLEAKAKKRKHKEDGSPSKQNDAPVATNGEEVKEKAKKRKKSKSSAEKGEEIVEKTKKKRKKSEKSSLEE